MKGLDELLTRWREEASAFERDAALVPGDRILRRVADELEVEVARYELELLTVRAAASESGYSADSIRRYIDAGRLACIRENGRILIHRRDLPRKPHPAPAPRDPKVAAESERLRRLTP